MIRKTYIIGAIIFIVVIFGSILLYNQTHTIKTIPYKPPTTQVHPDPGGPRANAVNSTSNVSPSAGASGGTVGTNTSTNTTNSTTNTTVNVLSPTPITNNSINSHSNEISPTIANQR